MDHLESVVAKLQWQASAATDPELAAATAREMRRLRARGEDVASPDFNPVAHAELFDLYREVARRCREEEDQALWDQVWDRYGE